MFGGTQGSTAAEWGRGSRYSDSRLGGVGSDLRQAVACPIAGSGCVDGAAWSPGSRRGSPRVAAVDERCDDRPPTVRGSCRGWRAPTAAELDALCSAPADPRSEGHRLGRSGAGVHGGGSGSAQRLYGARGLSAIAGDHGHRDRLDGVRPGAVPGADDGAGSCRGFAPAPAVRSSGLRRGQRQCVHERNASGLLPRAGDRVHTLPAVAEERPGVCGAEERQHCAPDRGVSPPGRA